jgi:lysophospholipase L1-like esterase
MRKQMWGTVFFMAAATCAAASPPASPAPLPALTPTVAAGEKAFYDAGRAVAPGMRCWVMGCGEPGADFWCYGTSQSVGDGAGLLLFAPAGAKVKPLCCYDTGLNLATGRDGKTIINAGPEYRGLSLWIRGDGSDAQAVITTDYSGNPKQWFRIPLQETNWHKVFIPWQQWNRSWTNLPAFWFLTYSLERSDTNRAHWYLVDRVRLYQEQKIEDITPTPDRDPPGRLPARAFASGREQIAGTLAKLAAKKPVKIVIAGDSIPCGAQLWYTVPNNEPEVRKRIYWQVLGHRLQQAFGYPGVSLVLRAPNPKTKAWEDTPTNRPAADLQVVAVAYGGKMAADGLTNLTEVLNEKPDLVVWEYGANDATFGSTARYAEATAAAVDRLKAAGIEVVIQTVTPTPGIHPISWRQNKSSAACVAEINVEARRIAAEKQCALADMEKAFTCRGQVFVGSLYADGVHPNHLGHEMLADVLDALLTNRDVLIWRHGPAGVAAR